MLNYSQMILLKFKMLFYKCKGFILGTMQILGLEDKWKMELVLFRIYRSVPIFLYLAMQYLMDIMVNSAFNTFKWILSIQFENGLVLGNLIKLPISLDFSMKLLGLHLRKQILISILRFRSRTLEGRVDVYVCWFS